MQGKMIRCIILTFLILPLFLQQQSYVCECTSTTILLKPVVVLKEREWENSVDIGRRTGVYSDDGDDPDSSSSKEDVVGGKEERLFPRLYNHNQPFMFRNGATSLTCYFCNIFFTTPNKYPSQGGGGGGGIWEAALSTQTGEDVLLFDQCLDHNQSPCAETFKQRYWINAGYFTQNAQGGYGPVFFQFGGEYNAEGYVNNDSGYASKHSALLIVLEHRFFGESFPVGNEDPSTPVNRTTHTSSQWMLDVIAFVTYIRTTYPETSNVPWVGFGCSYPGALTGWFMERYPGFFAAAVSSSAPLEVTFDFPGYFKVMSEAIYGVDTNCYFAIKNAFACFEALTTPNTLAPDSCGDYTTGKQLIRDLPNCPNKNWVLSDRKARSWYFSNFLQPFYENEPGTAAKKYCPILTKLSSRARNPVHQYILFMKSPEMVKLVPDCQGSESEEEDTSKIGEKMYLKLHKEAKGSPEAKKRDSDSWTWMTCNEFGYYMMSDPTYCLFGCRLIGSETYFGCDGSFGISESQVRANVAVTKRNYGGRNVRAKCTLFVNGSWDPWSSLSITSPSETNTTVNRVLFIQTSQHCEDHDWSDPDNGYIVAADKVKLRYIGEFLKDRNCVGQWQGGQLSKKYQYVSGVVDTYKRWY